ncbi:MAG: BatA domain-containing protein [Flavobacteriales bacterium]|nr:BatA domain-containing protein [Flavobacteriales bacterium]MBP6698595.1 BatA domain-containing protein [Flavobacteriales bacterium]
MTFLSPTFLWALLALAIPVLIHLFQLRRFKRLDFPDVRLLQEVTLQTRSVKKVRHWAVLLCRLAALTALVIAFAQPVLKQDGRTAVAGKQAVSVFIDDSYSMDGQNSGGRLMDQARKGAQDLIGSHTPTDRFQVLTGRFEGRQQLLLGKEEANEIAAQAETGPFSRPLSHVMKRQREALVRSDAQGRRLVLFTDLQRYTTDVENWLNDTLEPVLIVPLQPTDAADLSVDSAWFDNPVRRPGAAEVLHVRITNHGTEDLQNVPFRLTINGSQRAQGSFGAGGGASVDTALRFTQLPAGPHWGEVSISDAPIVFDDALTIAYRVTGTLRVLIIGGALPEGDRALSAVFRSDSGYVTEQRDLRSVDPKQVEEADLVVLNGTTEIPSGLAQQLNTLVEGGGALAVFPPHEGGLEAYNELLGQLNAGQYGSKDTATTKVARIDLDLPFYREVFSELPRNVDLPTVQQRYRWSPRAGSEVLLRLQDGAPFLTRHGLEQGQVFVGASPLDPAGGLFIRHALFVTSLLRMAESSRNSGGLYHVIASEGLVPLNGLEAPGEQGFRLLGPEGTDLLAETRRSATGLGLMLEGEDLPAGPYAITSGRDTLAMLALVHDRKESSRDLIPPQELRERLEQAGLSAYRVADMAPGGVSLSLDDLDRGRKLWPWFILVALLFLAAEVVLIRTKR